MGYFKKKISSSQLELLRKWDGKEAMRETRGCGFKSQLKNILHEYFSTKGALGTGYQSDIYVWQAYNSP